MSPTPVQAFPTDALELVIPLAPVVTTWLRCATPDGQEETRSIVFAMAFVILESKWERPTGTCDAISSQPDSILQQPQVWQLRHAASLSSIPAVQRHAYAAQPRTYACHVWNCLSCSEALPVMLDIASLPRPTVAWEGDEVDLFIIKNKIDGNDGQKLKTLPLAIQTAVMGQEDLAEARTPNAVLMIRIIDAERNVPGMKTHFSSAPPGTPSKDHAVEHFLAENRIATAAEDMLSLFIRSAEQGGVSQS